MSASSGSGPVPQLVGYRVEWDPQAQEWVASREGDASRVLRGKNQGKLERARWALVFDPIEQLRQVSVYALGDGYTPPPKDWKPQPRPLRTSPRGGPRP